MCDFYRQSKPKARKQHTCDYCGLKIHKGEVYSCEAGKYEGDFFSRKLCLTCFKILNEYHKESGEDEFDWDWIDDWLNDTYCHDCKQKDNCERYQPACPVIRDNFKPEEGKDK